MTFNIGQGIEIGEGIDIVYEFPTPPSIITNPTLSGTFKVRENVSVSTGTWNTGIPAPITNYSYQWQLGNANIFGATSNVYNISYLYSGQQIRGAVTAYNALNSNIAYSNNSSNILPNVPLPVTNAIASSNFGVVTISFIPNIDNGGANVDIFYANSNTGNVNSNSASSPITVTPTNLGNYTWNIVAHNSVGNSSPTTTNALNVTLTPTFVANYNVGERVYGIAASPDNKFLYAIIRDYIVWYSINANTGNITESNRYLRGPVGPPTDIKISTNGNFLYYIAPQSSTFQDLVVFSRNANTGNITSVDQEQISFNNTIINVLNDNSYLYTVGTDSSLKRRIQGFQIAGNGELTPTGSPVTLGNETIGATIRGFVSSYDNKNLYLQLTNPGVTLKNIYKFNINSGNGVLTADGNVTLPISSPPINLGISYSDTSLYSAPAGNMVTQYSRNTTNGNLSLVGTTYGGNTGGIYGTLIPTTDNILYTAAGSFHRNVSTGNLTFTNSNNALYTFSEGVITQNNEFIYTYNDGNIISIYKIV